METNNRMIIEIKNKFKNSFAVAVHCKLKGKNYEWDEGICVKKIGTKNITFIKLYSHSLHDCLKTQILTIQEFYEKYI